MLIRVLLLCLPALVTGRSTARAEDSAAWQLLGQAGGQTKAVAVQGRYAYAGVGPRLVVLDISEPTELREVGVTRPFPYPVEDIAVNGTLAYVASGGAGMRVVDVSDPAHPVETGAFVSRGYASGVAVAGEIAYLADGPYGLRVIDVSKPAQPTEVGFTFPAHFALKVATDGRYAYIAAAGAGLLVADVTDPRRPVEAGALATGGYAYGVAVAERTAFVADGWEGLKTVDVTDPRRPRLAGAYKTPGWAFGVAASGNRVSVADAFAGLRVLDVSDPAAPVEVAGSDIPQGQAAGVALAGGVAYVADLDVGVRALSLADGGLKQVACYRPPGYADAVAVAGDLAYVVGPGTGLRVMDTADAAWPRQVGALELPGYLSSVKAVGRYVYVGEQAIRELSGYLYVVDVSDPGRPVLTGTAAVGNCRDMDVADGIAYFATEFGLELVSVSNPARPVSLGVFQVKQQISAAATAVGVAVQGKLAFLASARAGLQIVDISSPRQPRLIGGYGTDSSDSQDVAVAGNMAYLADVFGVRLVNVADPAHPAELAYYELPGDIFGVAIAGETLYVASGSRGLHVLDVSDPSRPLLTGSFNTAGYSQEVAAGGERALVADGINGLVILQRGAGAREGGANAGGSKPGGMVSRSASTAPAPAPFVSAARRRASPARSDRAPRAGATCVVRSPADSGADSLRDCLEKARGGDTITFDPAAFPAAAPATISPTSALPALTAGDLTIDASNAGVVLDGRRMPPRTNGLVLASRGNTVKGLQILNFPWDGVAMREGAGNNLIGGDRGKGTGPMGEGNLISRNGRWGVSIAGAGSDGNVVSGNFIGTDSAGTSAAGNEGDGIMVSGGAQRNRLGGTTPGERNLISGNGGTGVTLYETSHNTVAGNFIGTDLGGARALPNRTLGIMLAEGASGNRVGGTDPQDRNLISGNGFGGISVMGSRTSGNSVLGNYVGTDASGSFAIGNQADGIGIVEGAFHNEIRGNLSSGNERAGVQISDWGSSYNVVAGNRLGTDASGTKAIPNGESGVSMGNAGAMHNRVGGTRPEDRNLISGNGFGVAIFGPAAIGNLVVGNHIGTDISGSHALPNRQGGVGLCCDSRGSVIGGASSQEANVISGNVHMGVTAGSVYDYVMGNYIGVDASGQTGLGNAGSGVWVVGDRNVVQGNVIAFSTSMAGQGAGNGINATFDGHNIFRRNAIYSNAGMGIAYPRGPRGVLLGTMLPAPVITRVEPDGVSGTACPDCEIEVFSDAGGQGRIFEGSTTADASGAFRLAKGKPLAGPNVTATATDREGSTSEFSAPRAPPKP
jgi:hypothetical protein